MGFKNIKEIIADNAEIVSKADVDLSDGVDPSELEAILNDAEITESLSITTEDAVGFEYEFDPLKKAYKKKKINLDPTNTTINYDIMTSTDGSSINNIFHITNTQKNYNYRVNKTRFKVETVSGERPSEIVEIVSADITNSTNKIFSFNKPWNSKSITSLDISLLLQEEDSDILNKIKSFALDDSTRIDLSGVVLEAKQFSNNIKDIQILNDKKSLLILFDNGNCYGYGDNTDYCLGLPEEKVYNDFTLIDLNGQLVDKIVVADKCSYFIDINGKLYFSGKDLGNQMTGFGQAESDTSISRQLICLSDTETYNNELFKNVFVFRQIHLVNSDHYLRMIVFESQDNTYYCTRDGVLDIINTKFDETGIKKIIHDYDWDDSENYYQTILTNGGEIYFFSTDTSYIEYNPFYNDTLMKDNYFKLDIPSDFKIEDYSQNYFRITNLVLKDQEIYDLNQKDENGYPIKRTDIVDVLGEPVKSFENINIIKRFEEAENFAFTIITLSGKVFYFQPKLEDKLTITTYENIKELIFFDNEEEYSFLKFGNYLAITMDSDPQYIFIHEDFGNSTQKFSTELFQYLNISNLFATLKDSQSVTNAFKYSIKFSNPTFVLTNINLDFTDFDETKLAPDSKVNVFLFKESNIYKNYERITSDEIDLITNSDNQEESIAPINSIITESCLINKNFDNATILTETPSVTKKIYQPRVNKFGLVIETSQDNLLTEDDVKTIEAVDEINNKINIELLATQQFNNSLKKFGKVGDKESYILLLENGEVYVYGENIDKCLGFEDETLVLNEFTKLTDQNGNPFKALDFDAMNNRTGIVFIGIDSQLYATGYNYYGRNGGGYAHEEKMPLTLIDDFSGENIIYIKAFNRSTFIQTDTGRIYTTGYNGNYECIGLSNDGPDYFTSFQEIDKLSGIWIKKVDQGIMDNNDERLLTMILSTEGKLYGAGKELLYSIDNTDSTHLLTGKYYDNYKENWDELKIDQEIFIEDFTPAIFDGYNHYYLYNFVVIDGKLYDYSRWNDDKTFFKEYSDWNEMFGKIYEININDYYGYLDNENRNYKIFIIRSEKGVFLIYATVYGSPSTKSVQDITQYVQNAKNIYVIKQYTTTECMKIKLGVTTNDNEIYFLEIDASNFSNTVINDFTDKIPDNVLELKDTTRYILKGTTELLFKTTIVNIPDEIKSKINNLNISLLKDSLVNLKVNQETDSFIISNEVPDPDPSKVWLNLENKKLYFFNLESNTWETLS